MTAELIRIDHEFRGLTHTCNDPKCHVQDFILSLSDRDDMHVVLAKVDDLTAQVKELTDLIDPIREEISPLLDKLAASPMFRMLTAGSDT